MRNKAAQFAQSLQRSMKGLGTKDDSLIRTVITRCEKDMVQIKEEFQQRYDDSLGKWIAVSMSISLETAKPVILPPIIVKYSPQKYIYRVWCDRHLSTKRCSRNYPQGGGPQALFLSHGGGGVLLTMCPRGGGAGG